MAFHLKQGRQFMEESGLDGLLLVSRENKFYTAGLYSGSGYVLITGNGCYAIVDGRYYVQQKARMAAAPRQMNAVALLADENCRFYGHINRICAGDSVRRLGFEAEVVSCMQYQKLENELEPELVPVSPDSMRMVKDEEEIASSPSQAAYATEFPLKPGDIKFKDLNGDRVIDDNDKCWYGNPTVPEIIYGFGFSLKYKGFDCSAFFQGQGKVSILMYNYHPFATAATPGSGLMQWIADEHWSEDDPNPKALYPRLSPLWNNNNTKASTLYVRNGKMLRLKTAEIGYTYKKMRVYVSGTNLLTFAPFKYWDPEKGSGNGLGYPLQRTYNLGFQFNF